MNESTAEYLERTKRLSMVTDRLTLAELAVIFEGRVDEGAKAKTAQNYRMEQYHIDMLELLAAKTGFNRTWVLRRIIDEWFEQQRQKALEDRI